MRILLDPVLTADPAKCSVTIQFYEFVRRTLEVEKRTDVFFYWIVPTHVEDEAFGWYPKHPNIQYIRMPRSKDRVRDYITMSPEMEEVLAFNGSHWDFDVLLTVRAMLIPLMRVIMNSPRTRKTAWTKEVWLIEDMPMMQFKTTVPTMVPDVHDRMTIEGHIAADRSFVCSYHERPEIIRAARQYFTPSIVRDLDAKLQDVVTAQFESYQLKTPDQYYTPGGDKPFGLAYIGRMEKANNIVDIHDIMLKTWVMRGDKVKLVVCTVSKVVPVFDTELVDVRQPNREEFWKIVKEEMHAFLKMPNGGGFSLSLIEPIMLGTPVLTIRTPAYESLLGKEYPLFAEGPSQVPGLVKALYDDYGYHYERFREWHENWFRPTYARRMQEDLLYTKLSAAIDAFNRKLEDRKSELMSLEENKMVQRLAELLGTQPEGCAAPIRTVFDGLRWMGESGEVDVLDKKTEPGDRLTRNITFSTPWNPYRLGLMLHYGYRDASADVGHLEKPKPKLKIKKAKQPT